MVDAVVRERFVTNDSFDRRLNSRYFNGHSIRGQGWRTHGGMPPFVLKLGKVNRASEHFQLRFVECSYAGSISVFSKTVRRQFGHLAGSSKMYSVMRGSEPVT